jgi:chromate transporter
MEKKLVEERGWLTNKEFMDAVAIGKLMPGLLMITIAFMGYKIGGVWGALLGTLGLFFPSFITVLIVTRLSFKFKESALLQSMFNGINTDVVGLLLGASILDTFSIVIVVPSFIIVALSKKIDLSFS